MYGRYRDLHSFPTRRSSDLLAKAGAARGALRRLGKRKADTLVQRLRRSLAELAAIDFFPGQAQRQAKDAMSALERSEEHTSELQSLRHLVCRLLLEKKNKTT